MRAASGKNSGILLFEWTDGTHENPNYETKLWRSQEEGMPEATSGNAESASRQSYFEGESREELALVELREGNASSDTWPHLTDVEVCRQHPLLSNWFSRVTRSHFCKNRTKEEKTKNYETCLDLCGWRRPPLRVNLLYRPSDEMSAGTSWSISLCTKDGHRHRHYVTCGCEMLETPGGCFDFSAAVMTPAIH